MVNPPSTLAALGRWRSRWEWGVAVRRHARSGAQTPGRRMRPGLSVTCKSPDWSKRDDRVDPGRDHGSRRPTTPTSTLSGTISSRLLMQDQDINNYCAVTAPMQAWPVTGHRTARLVRGWTQEHLGARWPSVAG